jgi:hypothetical protein
MDVFTAFLKQHPKVYAVGRLIVEATNRERCKVK